MKLVLASQNPGKLKELKVLLGHLPIELALAPKEFDPEETGDSYLANAEIKAREAARMTGELSVSDDSGIEVEALGWGPGVRSARYCDGSDIDRRRKMLQEMENVPEEKRSARYVCALVLADKDKVIYSTEAYWDGKLIFDERGEHGFGYDPIFKPDDCSMTSAQISPEEKNQKSHRAKAFNQLADFLQKQLQTKTHI
ncbi:MAG: RdgB/HAM1 family non-canonical purine NTP pyrophosphatase [Cyanobacteria bacterium TGS_CYA1]|nr:RdgB/HAM1 family non-canonical purine NTP pyrophosphatase [Cyanobacteria bacterium TGS_CYA1]